MNVRNLVARHALLDAEGVQALGVVDAVEVQEFGEQHHAVRGRPDEPAGGTEEGVAAIADDGAVVGDIHREAAPALVARQGPDVDGSDDLVPVHRVAVPATAGLGAVERNGVAFALVAFGEDELGRGVALGPDGGAAGVGGRILVEADDGGAVTGNGRAAAVEAAAAQVDGRAVLRPAVGMGGAAGEPLQAGALGAVVV